MLARARLRTIQVRDHPGARPRARTWPSEDQRQAALGTQLTGVSALTRVSHTRHSTTDSTPHVYTYSTLSLTVAVAVGYSDCCFLTFPLHSTRSTHTPR